MSWLTKGWRRLTSAIRRGLASPLRVETEGKSRRVVIQDKDTGMEGDVNDRFVLIIALMVLFFVGLVGLELVYMLMLRSFSEIIFNGIMLVVGTIVGAVWGNSSQ